MRSAPRRVVTRPRPLLYDRRVGIRLWTLAVLTTTLAGCQPTNVADAESREDVAWLANRETPSAIAALGRLANHSPKAREVLENRFGSDVNASIAAWTAAKENASWGAPFLRRALSDPARADVAASGMGRDDPALVPFVGDFDAALARTPRTSEGQGAPLASHLASIGPSAHAAVIHSLSNPSSRGAMCRAIANPDASDDARKALVDAPESSRDDAHCVAAAVQLALKEPRFQAWLATRAESGLLGAAARGTEFPCDKLNDVWRQAIAERTPEQHAQLTVALSQAIMRCGHAMDGALAADVSTSPSARRLIVMALDPFGTAATDLPLTCKALARPIGRVDSPLIRERTSDLLAHACPGAKGAGRPLERIAEPTSRF